MKLNKHASSFTCHHISTKYLLHTINKMTHVLCQFTLQRYILWNKRSLAIGADYVIEHKNQVMKVIGGILDLISNTESLEWLILAASEINSADTKFSNWYGIDVSKNKWDYLHQFSNLTKQSLTENTKTFSKMLHLYNVNFERNKDHVMNVATKAILLEEAEKDILSKKSEGKWLHDNYIDGCVNGETSIWDQMKKRNLK